MIKAINFTGEVSYYDEEEFNKAKDSDLINKFKRCNNKEQKGGLKVVGW
jgi:hypothetical protein